MPPSYDIFEDPYCYKGSSVLKNKRQLTDADALQRFENNMVSLRFDEAIPSGNFDPAHYRAIHHHLFQDVYDWAGEYRSIRIAKHQSMFCYPEHIASQMDMLIPRLLSADFQPGCARESLIAAAADFLADLNAIHPFREGNGRTQLTFLFLLGEREGQRFDMPRIRPQALLAAMVESFSGRVAALRDELEGICG